MNKAVGNYRFRILAMLFFATTINYFDRSLLGMLAPTLFKLFDWTNADYALINIFFKIAYAIGNFTIGSIIDKIGTKKGYVLSIGLWSIFGMLHATIQRGFSVVGFIVARFGLGIGESGNFPAAIKTVAEWFPKKERAQATGIFNAAASIGAILAPLVILAVVDGNTGEGWRIPFLITGALSSIWVFLWLKTYKKPEEHPKLSKEELGYIQSDSIKESSEGSIPWTKVILKRQTWAFASAKLTDAVWWFYLFWGAKFLYDQFGLDIKKLALPMIVIYLMADIGSIAGGWLSSKLIKRGWSINKARKTTLFICAVIILPVMFVAKMTNPWIAVVLIGIGAAGHQAWSANVYTLVSDVFPKKATASVVGIAGMTGTTVGIVADYFLGQTLDNAGTSGYFYAFMIAGSMYMVVLGLVQLLVPKMTPLDDNLELLKDK